MLSLDREALGQRVDEAIRAAGMTQQSVADQIGVSPAQLSRLVRAKRQRPNLELLWDVAQTVGVSLDYLLTGQRTSALPLAEGVSGDPEDGYRAIAIALAQSDRIRAETERLRVTQVDAVLQQTIARLVDRLAPLVYATGDAPAAAQG